jgi:hypothetical protein
MSIVTLADFKTAIGTTANPDAELQQMLDRVDGMIFGEVGQVLTTTTYTDEEYSGNDTPRIALAKYPITTLTSVTIENEAAVTVNSATIRVVSGVLIEFVNGRIFPRVKPNNVKVTYTAGYSSIKTGLPEVWTLAIETATMLYSDAKAVKTGVSSQSFMDGSISFFTKESFRSEFVRNRWDRVLGKYRRKGRSTAPAWEPTAPAFPSVVES